MNRILFTAAVILGTSFQSHAHGNITSHTLLQSHQNKLTISGEKTNELVPFVRTNEYEARETREVDVGLTKALECPQVKAIKRWNFTSVVLGVWVNSEQNVFVGEPNLINQIDASGKVIHEWGEFGTGDGQFDWITGIAFDANDDIYVVDSGNHRIQVFNKDRIFKHTFGSFGTGEGEFDWPSSIAVDRVNNFVYIADENNHRVQKMKKNGEFVMQWGKFGDKDGEFDTPAGIAIDLKGHILVVELFNHRVQKFNSEGEHIQSWGSRGSDVNEFNQPRGIAVDAEGLVYVCDTFNFRVQIFTKDGIYVSQFGEKGYSEGQFRYPFGIAINTSGEIYVSDWLQDSLQSFTMSSCPSAHPFEAPTPVPSTAPSANVIDFGKLKRSCIRKIFTKIGCSCSQKQCIKMVRRNNCKFRLQLKADKNKLKKRIKKEIKKKCKK